MNDKSENGILLLDLHTIN